MGWAAGADDAAEIPDYADCNRRFADHRRSARADHGLAIAAGVFVAVTLPWLMKVFRIANPAAAELAAGMAGSGIATARVVPMGKLPLAFAGVAIG